MRKPVRAITSGHFGMGLIPPPVEPQQPQTAPARDTTLSQPVGGGSGSGVALDIYGQGSPKASRDLTMNPLSPTELRSLDYVQKGIGGLMPFVGGVINQGIDYNLGRMVDPNASTEIGGLAFRESLGYRTALAEKTGMPFSDAAAWAARSKGEDIVGGVTDMFGTKPPVPVEDRGTYANVGTGGGGGGGISSLGVSPNAGMSVRDQYASYGSGRSGGGGGGFSGGGAATGGRGGDASGGGDRGTRGGFADGGMVGLTGPMMNQAPATLTQMGFADGGAVGLGAPAGSMGPDQLQDQINQFVRNPQFKQVAQQAVGGAMASGELTAEELVTLGRIAEAAMHNPALYPQLRQFASQNGLTPLPPSYDPRLVVVLIAASKLMGATPPGQVPPMETAQMQNPTGMANGGFLRGPGTGRSDSIGTVEESTGKPVKVANGEYVIPAHVVAAKGKDFFDKMLRQYAQLTPQE